MRIIQRFLNVIGLISSILIILYLVSEGVIGSIQETGRVTFFNIFTILAALGWGVVVMMYACMLWWTRKKPKKDKSKLSM